MAAGVALRKMQADIEAQVRRQAEHDAEIEKKIARHRRLSRFTVVAVICVLVLAVAFMAWKAFTRASAPKMGPTEYYAEALALHEAGKGEQGLMQLKRVLQAEPQHGDARWLLGLVHLSLGDGRAAEKELRHARLLGRDGEDIRYALFEAMLFERRYTEILVDTIGLESGAQHRPAIYRAEAQLGLRRNPKALETIRAVLAEQPNSVGALSALARLYFSMGDMDDMPETIKQLRTVAPDNVETNLLAGRFELLRGRYTQAREAFDAAMAIEANHPEGRLGTAQSYLAEGRPDSALTELRKIKNDRYQLSQYLSTVAYVQKGDVQTARAGLRKFLNNHPSHLDALMLMAQINHRQQEHRQAEGGLLRLLALAPDDVDALKLLASVHLDIGQLEQAIAVLERAAALRPDDTVIPALQARAYLAGGQEAKAEEFLTLAASLAEGAAPSGDGPPEWQLARCGTLVHFCQKCLYVRECR